MFDITIHRDINKSVIHFKTEQLLNVFYGIIKKFNKEENRRIIEMSKTELFELTGFSEKNYHTKIIDELIEKLTSTEKTPFIFSDNEKISGSLFVIQEFEDKLKIEIPELYYSYIYNKTDIEKIINIKEFEILEINDENLKTKENILLLKQADLLKIKGKYNKRLYTLLMASKGEHFGHYKENYQKFKKILGIKESYQEGTINNRILTKKNDELKKAGITIKKIEKVKDFIKIDFIYNLVKEEKKQDKKDSDEVEKIFSNNTDYYKQSDLLITDKIAETGISNIEKIKEIIKNKSIN